MERRHTFELDVLRELMQRIDERGNQTKQIAVLLRLTPSNELTHVRRWNREGHLSIVRTDDMDPVIWQAMNGELWVESRKRLDNELDSAIARRVR